jgi:glycosyltransferase involved in cell wall biosynthesis
MATNEPVRAPAAPPPPRVSIVVPAYNSEHYVGSTIESVLAQTLSDWELVVFDDGSADGTLGVANAYARRDARVRVAQGLNSGVASARNRGLALTDPRADYVAFLDNDDMWEPYALEVLVDVLDRNPQYVAAHGSVRCIDADGNPVRGDDLEDRCRDRQGFRNGRLVRLQPDEPTTFGALVYHNCVVSPGAALIRRDAVVFVGGFDRATEPADDADLELRISRLGDFGFVDRPVLRWRRHPEAQSGTSRRWRTASFRIRAKTLTDPANTADQLRSSSLALRGAAVAGLRSAAETLRRGAWGAALRQALYAIALYEVLFRGRITTEIRRAVRTRSTLQGR